MADKRRGEDGSPVAAVGRCRMYESVLPAVGDLVMVRTVKISDVSATVSLLEYGGLEAMLLLSEATRRRVTSIHRILRLHREEVMAVIRVDTAKRYVDVSKRNISPEASATHLPPTDQPFAIDIFPSVALVIRERECYDVDSSKCQNRYNKSRAVHSIVHYIASQTKMEPLHIYEQFVWDLYRRYGHAYDALQIAAADFSASLNPTVNDPPVNAKTNANEPTPPIDPTKSKPNAVAGAVSLPDQNQKLKEPSPSESTVVSDRPLRLAIGPARLLRFMTAQSPASKRAAVALQTSTETGTSSSSSSSSSSSEDVKGRSERRSETGTGTLHERAAGQSETKAVEPLKSRRKKGGTYLSLFSSAPKNASAVATPSIDRVFIPEYKLDRESKLFKTLVGTLRHRFTPKPIKLRCDIELRCESAEGIDRIKAALKAGEAASTPGTPIKARLIAPPLYVLNSTTTAGLDQGLQTMRLASKAVEDCIMSEPGGVFEQQREPHAVSAVEEQNLRNLMERLAKENEQVDGDDDADDGSVPTAPQTTAPQNTQQADGQSDTESNTDTD